MSIGNASPVILVSVLLFVFTAPNGDDGAPGPILEWGAVQARLPWGLILLLGGGFAVAEASGRSCLSHWVGTVLAGMAGTVEPWTMCK